MTQATAYATKKNISYCVTPSSGAGWLSLGATQKPRRVHGVYAACPARLYGFGMETILLDPAAPRRQTRLTPLEHDSYSHEQ